jgi:hypothetical protein
MSSEHLIVTKRNSPGPSEVEELEKSTKKNSMASWGLGPATFRLIPSQPTTLPREIKYSLLDTERNTLNLM